MHAFLDQRTPGVLNWDSFSTQDCFAPAQTPLGVTMCFLQWCWYNLLSLVFNRVLWCNTAKLYSFVLTFEHQHYRIKAKPIRSVESALELTKSFQKLTNFSIKKWQNNDLALYRYMCLYCTCQCHKWSVIWQSNEKPNTLLCNQQI